VGLHCKGRLGGNREEGSMQPIQPCAVGWHPLNSWGPGANKVCTTTSPNYLSGFIPEFLAICRYAASAGPPTHPPGGVPASASCAMPAGCAVPAACAPPAATPWAREAPCTRRHPPLPPPPSCLRLARGSDGLNAASESCFCTRARLVGFLAREQARVEKRI